MPSGGAFGGRGDTEGVYAWEALTVLSWCWPELVATDIKWWAGMPVGRDEAGWRAESLGPCSLLLPAATSGTVAPGSPVAEWKAEIHYGALCWPDQLSLLVAIAEPYKGRVGKILRGTSSSKGLPCFPLASLQPISLQPISMEVGVL